MGAQDTTDAFFELLNAGDRDGALRLVDERGEIKDTGHQVECDILVVRPGAPSQKIDAVFKVEAGKISAINLSPR